MFFATLMSEIPDLLDQSELKPLVYAVLFYAGVFCVLAPALVIIYFLVSFPFRRRERQRLFLDVLEAGLAQGLVPEQTILSLSKYENRIFGSGFQRLAAYLKGGIRFFDALVQVPDLLPARSVAMLKVGAAAGDLRKVMPACRSSLASAVFQGRLILNISALTAFLPLIAANILAFLAIKIFPKFEEIFKELLNGAEVPALSLFVFGLRPLLALLPVLLLFLVGLVVFYYFAGSASLKDLGLQGWADRIAFRMPWHQKRLQRDFSAMLALLLDSGMPEKEAILLAAESAANEVFVRRARAVVKALEQGAPLTEALRAFDDVGEFQWRLANARHGGGGFAQALAGWHEALDAKVFQLEQALTQFVSAGLVLFNGLMIGLLTVGIFMPLVAIIMNLNLSLW